MAKHTIVLIPGDGIGPEVSSATQRVLEAAGLDVEWVVLPAGATAVEQGFDNVLPQRTVAAIQAHKVALKGPITTPIGKGTLNWPAIFAQANHASIHSWFVEQEAPFVQPPLDALAESMAYLKTLKVA